MQWFLRSNPLLRTYRRVHPRASVQPAVLHRGGDAEGLDRAGRGVFRCGAGDGLERQESQEQEDEQATHGEQHSMPRGQARAARPCQPRPPEPQPGQRLGARPARPARPEASIKTGPNACQKSASSYQKRSFATTLTPQSNAPAPDRPGGSANPGAPARPLAAWRS